ncbi:MAG: hypothetical protein H7282_06055 [Cytophagaceae bacterium]|nr:hypothetical protein [Cytophagaceae bacterium]
MRIAEKGWHIKRKRSCCFFFTIMPRHAVGQSLLKKGKKFNINVMSKLQRNSPTPLNAPKKKDNGDEGTEATKKSSTIVGQPETGKPKSNQFNERDNEFRAYTD